MRKVLRPKREEVKGAWKKGRNHDIFVLCSSPTVIRVVKSRTVRWVRRVLCVGEKINASMILVVKAEGNSPRGPVQEHAAILGVEKIFLGAFLCVKFIKPMRYLSQHIVYKR
jgi:hypothetical protein